MGRAFAAPRTSHRSLPHVGGEVFLARLNLAGDILRAIRSCRKARLDRFWVANRHGDRGCPCGSGDIGCAVRYAFHVTTTENTPTPPRDGGGYGTDDPISSSAEDRFSRKEFAYRVAHTVAHRSSPSSLVVGLYGAWGEGKTSVLRMIEEALSNDNSVRVFWFNPWRYPDEDALLDNFLRLMGRALKSEISTKAEMVGDFLNRAKSLIKPLGKLVGLSGDEIDEAITKLKGVTPEELKGRVDDLLSRSGVRLVVLLDDLDRMDQDEIRAVFRLLKLTLNFKNSVFIVAFDEEVIVEALAKQYGTSSRQFLEKIIHVPLQLPRAAPIVLREICFASVDEAVRLAGLTLDDADARRFVHVFDQSILPSLRTPRSARRYTNALTFALAIMAGEVNPADLVLIEAVRMFYPDLYASLRQNRDLYVWSVKGHLSMKDEEGRAARRAAIMKAISERQGDDLEAALFLIQTLFPLTANVLSKTGGRTDPDDAWTQAKRVASHQYFDRYFSYGISSKDISDADFYAFADSLASADAATVAAKVQVFATERRGERFLEKVRLAIPSLTENRCAPLAKAIAANAELFSGRSSVGFTDLSETAVARVSWLIERLPPQDRLATASECLHVTPDLSFAVSLLRWMNPKGLDAPPLTVSEHATLGQELGKRISNAVQDQPAWRIFGKNTASTLLVWADAAGRDVVWAHLRPHLRSDPSLVPEFLESMLTTATSLTTGESIRRAFSRTEYNYVKAVADTDELAALIEGLGIAPELGSEFGDTPHPARQSAARFLAIHTTISSESDSNERVDAKPDTTA